MASSVRPVDERPPVGKFAATGIRIQAGVDFKKNSFNSMIVAISIGVGMVPLVAPNFEQWMPQGIHPPIASCILLASLCAASLKLFFNGAPAGTSAAIKAAAQANAY